MGQEFKIVGCGPGPTNNPKAWSQPIHRIKSGCPFRNIQLVVWQVPRKSMKLVPLWKGLQRRGLINFSGAGFHRLALHLLILLRAMG